MYVLYNAGESQLSPGVASLDTLVLEALEARDGNGNINKRDAVRVGVDAGARARSSKRRLQVLARNVFRTLENS
jgi:hypothetical protein